MCFPSPGPRCSYHAHKEYVAALQKYENCLDAELKLKLGVQLEAKREAYYSTRRGQNFLRREADAATGLERDQLLLQLQAAEKLREKQLDDYHNMLERKDTTFKEHQKEAGYKISKYGAAAAMALLYLKTNHENVEAEIVSRDTIKVNAGLILVLPAKYQAVWDHAKLVDGVYQTSSSKLDHVLNSSLSLSDLTETAQDEVLDWFAEQLTAKGYIAVASVNTKTQDVAIFDVHNLETSYEPSLKVMKRLGGTADFHGDVEDVKKAIQGTPFEGGQVVTVEDLKKTIIVGVPPQSKKACSVSDEFFMGWRDSAEGGYFEVRRKHHSTNFDVILKLKAERTLFVSGIEPELKEKLVQTQEG